VRGQLAPSDRDLMFQNGWLSTGNPACGTQRWERHGHHHLFVHNLGSATDELYDLQDSDAGNLGADPGQKRVCEEMGRRMYTLLQNDARWGYYRMAFHFQHYSSLKGA
jgi:hypothetical protein